MGLHRGRIIAEPPQNWPEEMASKLFSRVLEWDRCREARPPDGPLEDDGGGSGEREKDRPHDGAALLEIIDDDVVARTGVISGLLKKINHFTVRKCNRRRGARAGEEDAEKYKFLFVTNEKADMDRDEMHF